MQPGPHLAHSWLIFVKQFKVGSVPLQRIGWAKQLKLTPWKCLWNEQLKTLSRGTKRLVSVNICSVRGNSADIFDSKVSLGIFVVKEKWMPIIFGTGKTAVLGAIKAQLLFSGGKYQLLNSWNNIPLPKIFYHLNFQLPHPNRSNSGSSQK